jgi:FixJ family two-component response regulator
MLVAIVDDDATVLKALKRLLLSNGWHVATFVSGEEFLEWIGSNHADCAVVDISMPGMNGIDVQKKLRKMGEQLPCITITAREEDWIWEQALAAGAASVLKKPLDERELLTAIGEALRTKKSEDPELKSEGLQKAEKFELQSQGAAFR